MEQRTVITREIVLGIPPDEAWGLIGDADGWADWMVDAADVTVAPGAEGTVREPEGEREVRIGEVVDGERVSFAWWPAGDDGRVSLVELLVVPTPAGAGLRIVETFPAARPVTRAARAWEVRAAAAWARCQARVLAAA